MDIPFTCSSPHGSWEGLVRLKDPMSGEMDISARGSLFHIICGRYSGGRYLCIPAINIGAGLSRLTDTFWNREHLEACCPDLSETDIISITEGLAAVSSYLFI